ncbi:PREDICTED: alpha-tocopherol transfer protein-like [Nicrophorus vespilloides]|uniref:Alpha-tocopherol transfer protein-like n=1 Tax=Nicrophorus vespilloides TaxID=110193 RepID=A0ABM1NEF7_NICVS|nr:PREDICTED: alpha-tocopherol transfer protein-like [Nicrophorus vespilloides]
MELVLEGPSEETFKKIQDQLGEVTERFEHNVKLLEEWMACQPHLPKNYDKRILPIFLRGSKHDMEKTKKKLESYFTVKAAIPALFSRRDPERKDILETIEYSDFVVMPKLTPEGYRVTISNLKTNDLSKFKIDILMARGALSACLRTAMETPISGDVLIYDASNISAAHAAIFLTPTVRKCIIDGPEAYPNRLRQIHVINAHPIIDKVVSIIKTLIKEKIRQRFYVHSKPEMLLNYIPSECLPNEYGGSGGKLENLSKMTHNFAVKNAGWLKEQESAKLIGPLPDKYRYDEDYGTGTEGSFRKLAID